MPLHHYLPATFLANFSVDDVTNPRRDRMIFVGDKKSKLIFQVSAGNAGAINNLYTLLDYKEDPEYLEKLWSNYEDDLHVAIPRLIVDDIDAKTWIRLLVPFVTCMLVRGADFDVRFTGRIESIFGHSKSKEFLGRNQINGARILEIQRLLFPVTSAKWIVIHTPGEDQLLTNDLGYCPFINPRTIDYGMAVPLGKRHVLAISPRRSGQILHFDGGKWRPRINYTENQFDNNNDLNRSIVSMAQRFIFSPTYELAKKYLHEFSGLSRPIEPEQLGFIDGYHSRAYEFTWHRLAIFLEKNNEPIEKEENFTLDWKYLFNGWNPPVIIPTNLTGFPPPLIGNKYSISFKCYEPDDYYLLNRLMDLERMKLFNKMINEANKGVQNTKNDHLKIEFFFSISIALFFLGDKKNSSKILDMILEINPIFHKARLNRIANLLEDRRLDEAYQDILFLISNDPESVEARINLTNYYIITNEFDNAIIEANIACEKAPKGNLLGSALASRALTYFSDKQMKKSFEDFSNSLEFLRDEEKKGFCFLYKAITGLLLSKENNLVDEILIKDYSDEDAINDLTESINLLAESSELLITALDMRGDLFQKQGKPLLALDDFSRAGELDIKNPKFLCKQGEILIALGDFEQSIIINNKAIELSPKEGGSINNRGIARLLQEDSVEAKKDFLTSIKLFGDSPESGSPLRHLVHISLLENKLKEAKNYLQKSIIVDPDSPFNIILDNLIKIYNNNAKEALNNLESFLTEFKTICDLRIYMIFPLVSMNKIEDGKSIYSICINNVTDYTKQLIKMHIRRLLKNSSQQVSWSQFSSNISEIETI